MPDSPFAAFPARPGDVGEWEELLVRFELAPRAVRFALDPAPAGLDTPDPALAGVAAELHALAEREAEAWGWMQALREAAPLGGWEEAGEVPADGARGGSVPLRDDLQRFSSLRARNFAWVQRRGLEVWEWQAAHPRFGEVTAFQLISWLVRHDGQRLARVRATLRAPEPC